MIRLTRDRAMSESTESFEQAFGTNGPTQDQLIELRVRTTDGEFQSHELVGELIVGRDSRCDVVILDPFLSRRHARLYRAGPEVIVEDTSRNGTRVNGDLIERPTPIAPGDLIEVHGHRIELAADRDLSSAQGAIYRPANELRQTESGVRILTSDADELRDAVERLQRVTEIYEALARFSSKEQLLPRVLEHAFEVFDADVGDIFLQTEQSGYVRAANRCRSAAIEPSPFSRSLLKRVCDDGLAVIVPDVFQDPHLTGDSMVGIQSRSIAAAPIAIDQTTLGMLVPGQPPAGGVRRVGPRSPGDARVDCGHQAAQRPVGRREGSKARGRGAGEKTPGVAAASRAAAGCGFRGLRQQRAFACRVG